MKKFLLSLARLDTDFARIIVAILIIMLLAVGNLGYFEPVKKVLDSELFTFKLGTYSLSIYKSLKGILVIIALFWLANVLAALGEKRLKQLKKIKVSNRALIIKGFQIMVYFIIFMIGLDILGLDLTAFAVLGGAVGIGIGFGLQKVTANFISGLILLFEKSIKAGDLIELNDGIVGYVKDITARYTLIETFEKREIMIPNEEFITHRVSNWTFTNSQGRVEIHVAVSYASDLRKAKELLIEAAKAYAGCSLQPEPKCFLDDFSDSAINFCLYFWVDDVKQGRKGAKSEVLFLIWEKFKENNVEMPYPQMDLHIKSPENMTF